MKPLKILAVAILLSCAITLFVREQQMQCALAKCSARLDNCQKDIVQLRAELAATRALAAAHTTENDRAKMDALASDGRKATGVVKPQDSVICYDTATRLDVGNQMTVSSPTGVMVSDNEKKLVGGDLLVETPDAKYVIADGLVDVATGKITGKGIEIVRTNTPNVKVEVTEGVIEMEGRRMTGRGMKVTTKRANQPLERNAGEPSFVSSLFCCFMIKVFRPGVAHL